MIDLTIHYQGNKSHKQRLQAIPRAGDYILDSGKVWRCDRVVHSTSTATWGKGSIDVYTVAVAEDRASELRTAWKA